MTNSPMVMCTESCYSRYLHGTLSADNCGQVLSEWILYSFSRFVLVSLWCSQCLVYRYCTQYLIHRHFLTYQTLPIVVSVLVLCYSYCQISSCCLVDLVDGICVCVKCVCVCVLNYLVCWRIRVFRKQPLTVSIILIFFATRSPSSVGRSPRNLATLSEGSSA